MTATDFFEPAQLAIDDALGPIDDMFKLVDAITPDAIQELEDKLVDYVRGYVGDDTLNALRNLDVPEASGLCEFD